MPFIQAKLLDDLNYSLCTCPLSYAQVSI